MGSIQERIDPLRAAMHEAIVRTPRRVWIDLGILVLILSAFAVLFVRTHWTSIWMDREFTSFVAPIANRLDGSFKMYADGGHIPIPPLPFVLMRLVTQGHATWLSESVANYLFQCLTLLLMYAALSRSTQPPVAFMATIASIPHFFCLLKGVLYDSMAQASVALLVLLATTSSCRPRTSRPHWAIARLLPLALVSALSLLTKQSTGLGAFIGLGAGLLLFDRGNVIARFRTAIAYGFLTLVSLAVLVALLAPFADPIGLVRDVFVRGSEPKGGPERMLANLVGYTGQIWQHTRLLLLPLGGALALLMWYARGTRLRRDLLASRYVQAVAVLFPLLLSAVYLGIPELASIPYRTLGFLWHIPWIGLVAGMVLSLLSRFPRCSADWAGVRHPRRFAVVFLLVFAAAVFHSLSSDDFRWLYDNNPLIVVAYAGFFQLVLQIPRRLSWPVPGRVALAALCLLLAMIRPWVRVSEHVRSSQNYTERWEEVPYLAGARLSPTADGMRRLVEAVRKYSAVHETVLLLPNDPNVEAWFERRRPRLSSLFVFADQYWDEFVEADFAALEADPPKVIVIGPARFWRGFHRMWNTNYGAERLIDRISSELLPAHYQRRSGIPILHRGRRDTMQLYVRIDEGPRA